MPDTNFEKAVQQTINNLKKCLDIKDGSKAEDIRLMVKPCEDRPDTYDLFTVRNINYNKVMGDKSSYNMYLDKYFLLNGKKVRDANPVASFVLMQFPGCCGIALSTQAFVSQNYRRKGIGTILNKLRIEIARHNGYTVLVCTAVSDNITPKILLKNGWAETLGLTNKRTENHVILYSIYL